ncbi:MAG: 23S rRNA (pseudouridine(1915)-N(3))-methyltransferase RlmH [Chlamydiia bacterium]|nr:23S rRNA (pseudouridine(1915)-N(3))-methyltransferase RlmH [Chlamydiia bacterium]
MIKVRILSVGKTKEAWLKEALAEYDKRLTGRIEIETILFKDESRLYEESGAIFLDPEGPLLTSEAFAQKFEGWSQTMRPVTFVIGGAEGFDRAFLKGKETISLSKMTFTHQLTRLILAEQIYRAHCILSKIPYHK